MFRIDLRRLTIARALAMGRSLCPGGLPDQVQPVTRSQEGWNAKTRRSSGGRAEREGSVGFFVGSAEAAPTQINSPSLGGPTLASWRLGVQLSRTGGPIDGVQPAGR